MPSAKSKKTANGSTKNQNQLAAAAGRVVQSVPKQIRPQLASLANPLTSQDEAILAYLVSMSNPWVDNPSGVPLILGSGGIVTRKFAIPRTFTVQAGTNGFGFLTMNADGWLELNEDPSSTYRYAAYSGQTGGTNVWYTTSAFTGVAIPTQATTTATAGIAGGVMPTIDASMNSTSAYRMVGMALRVWADDAALTTKGDVYVISTSEPFASGTNGGLPFATEASITSLNSEVASVVSAPLSGWKSGTKMSTFAVPSAAAAFRFNSGVTTALANNTLGYPQIGIMITGCAAGQTVKVETCFLYEVEKQQDYARGDMPEPQVPVSDDRVLGSHLIMNQIGPSEMPVRPHSTGLHNGVGAKAFVQQLMNNEPSKLLSLQKEVRSPSAGWLDAGLKGLSFIGDRVIDFLPKKFAAPASFVKKWLFDE